ncbi:hypothetical protein HFO24_16980 [Rhizobium laguerreae]|uniref:hypothetical protein n=1 Tax=Rhizobium laguerreae TaxID=1076926 RepID=UPI001C925E65|nr:hypothetical protein [Rhizobium laguerreae]MBY3183348.1 hypothetical protein [Rhizobium laguerreae]
MTKVIVVQGISSSGKTSSIRKFVEDLGVFLPQGDIRLALPYQKGGRTFCVGVSSAGDNVQALNAAFNFLLQLKCDFVVCASKSSGITVSHLQGIITSNGFASVIVGTTWVASRPGQLRQNAQTAKDIDGHIF